MLMKMMRKMMIVIDNDHHDRLDGNDDAYHVGEQEDGDGDEYFEHYLDAADGDNDDAVRFAVEIDQDLGFRDQRS